MPHTSKIKIGEKMKNLTPIEKLNLALSEHSVASGYGPVKKDEGAAVPADAPTRHSASVNQSLSARQGKPSSRSAFNSGHSQSGTGAFKKPLASMAPAQPAKPKPISPIKPLTPLKPIS